MVRMVTGDNVHTASHIAKECGILMEGGLALEGPVFRKMTEEEVIPMLPKLQVRSRPSRPDYQPCWGPSLPVEKRGQAAFTEMLQHAAAHACGAEKHRQ